MSYCGFVSVPPICIAFARNANRHRSCRHNFQSRQNRIPLRLFNSAKKFFRCTAGGPLVIVRFTEMIPIIYEGKKWVALQRKERRQGAAAAPLCRGAVSGATRRRSAVATGIFCCADFGASDVMIFSKRGSPRNESQHGLKRRSPDSLANCVVGREVSSGMFAIACRKNCSTAIDSGRHLPTSPSQKRSRRRAFRTGGRHEAGRAMDQRQSR